MKDRRHPKFTERLSCFMAGVAAVGGAYVLLDPKITFSIEWVNIVVGGEGFSPDLKGAVVSLILIGGWVAVKEYWLGASATSQNQAESMSRIAEASAPNVVPSGAPIKADDVLVTANTATVTTETPPKETQ